MKLYKTTNTDVAAALKTAGYNIYQIVVDDSNRVNFIFPDSPKLRNAVIQHESGQLRLSSKLLQDIRKSLVRMSKEQLNNQ